MNTKPTKDINRIFAEEGHLIDEAIKEGVRQALVRHMREGQPVVIFRDGKIEWVPAEELLSTQTFKVAERPDSEYGESD